MDLVAEKLHEYVDLQRQETLQTDLFKPSFRRIATAFPFKLKHSGRFNLDRLLNRFITYPRLLKRHLSKYDSFHVADHTYAVLVHSLPSKRTGVYCHDLDAFRCLIEPELEPRPWWFRKMSSHVLAGMQKAEVVFHSTLPVREKIIQHRLIPEHKLVHAPYGVSEEFHYGESTTQIPEWLQPAGENPWILHVGSCIPRKRIDVLLKVFAQLRNKSSDLKLVKIGGEFSVEQLAIIQSLELQKSIIHVTGVSRSEMAVAYRLANCVLVTSEAEGFGLPVIEALACGATIVASDIPVLREVGGDACVYVQVGDVGQWADVVQSLLRKGGYTPSLETRLQQASKYTWENHARIIADAYLKLI